MKKDLHHSELLKFITSTKKIFRTAALLFVVLFNLNGASASVNNYTFASSSGTYTPIAGTVLFSGTWDDSNSPLLTIPFSFSYNGNNYTTLGVNSNGFITLGALTNTVYCGLQTSAPNSIAGYGTDLRGNAGSTVQYATTGVAPNRQFIIQWTDCKQYFQTTDHYTFQIILNETSNTAQVIWGPVTAVGTTGANNCADVAAESGDVGLKGSSNVDFNIMSVTNGTNTWATSVNDGTLSSVCNMSPTNFPASGLTYTWTPPVPTPMVYVSSNTVLLNNGSAVSLTANRQIYQVQVVTTGNLSPLDVTGLVLSTAGSTNASTDIANAKVFFTGGNAAFSTASQFGSTDNNPDGAYTVNGSSTLSEGTNYFWITYDINPTATLGDLVSGCCTSLTGSGSFGTQTPSVTCPPGSQTIMNLGTWTPVASLAPNPNMGGMLLLSDGTAICHSSGGGGEGRIYDKLTPDPTGNYINGTWSSIAPMINDRLFYSSQVLKDGRVYVAGGEYGAGLNLGEVYNPLTNTWTVTPSPGRVSDANTEILDDGRVLQALVQGTTQNTAIYNPATNTYVTGPDCTGGHNESVWVKLPDNSILFVNIGTVNSERYITATNTWVPDANVPVNLYDPYGFETGGAVLLPNGKAFYLGSQGTTAYYTPSGTSSPGTWEAGPTVPNSLGAPDASCAMMANGKVLCAFSPKPVSDATLFIPPTYFYEFDYLTNSFTQTSAPGGGTSMATIGCFQTCMLNLPDGSVLYGQNQNATSRQYYIYTPSGAQTASGKPHIDNIQQLGCDTYTLSGTQFNGISEGASYGDDWQSSTNYPIVRLTSGSNVYYCRTSNWNSTGVMRGNAPDNVSLTLPAGLPDGTYSLVVTANGIASDPVSFTTGFFTWYDDLDGDGYYGVTQQSCMSPGAGWSLTTLGPDCNDTEASVHEPPTVNFSGLSSAICINEGTITLTGNYAPGGTFSGDGITDNGDGTATFNPVSATAGSHSITYSYTIAAGCSNSISQTVLVNDAPTVSFSGLSAAYCIDAGAVTLTGVPAGGTFMGAEISGDSFNPASVGAGGPYTVTYSYTDGNGCTNSSSQPVTVNALPVVSFTGLSSAICIDAGAITLTGTPTGGTFSGTGISGNSFNPASAGVGGPYSITYSYTDGNGCSNSISQNVTVNALPVVSFTGLSSSYCINANAVTLTGTPTGGTFSGAEISGNIFNPASVGVGGPYSVTYSYTDGNGCSNSISQPVTVNALPVVSFTGLSSSYCINANAVTLTGTPAGGTFSGIGISGNNFNPSTAGPGGPYSITYSYTDGNGCSNSISQPVTVNALPVVSFTGLSTTACVNAGTISLTGIPSGGTFSGTGISGNNFNPATAGPGGPYSITYSYLDGNGCSNSTSQNVTVNPIPNAIATPLSQTICSGSAISSIAITGSVVGTTFNWTRNNTGSVTGILASGSGTISGVLTNTTNSAVTVTFTITPTANGCLGTPITATVIIKPTPNAVATPSSQTVCSGSYITSIVLSGSVSGTTFTWTRNNTVPCSDIANSGYGNISGELTNTTSAPVTVTFTITPSANGCTGTPITATVLVNPKTNISGNPANQAILTAGNTSFSVTATGTSITYQWQLSTNGGSSYSNLLNGGVYSGATTATLNLTAVPLTMNGFKYRCVVKGSCSTATSSSALLTVSNPCQNATGLTTTNITSSGAKLNWVAANDPAQWQVQYKTTATGSVWKDVLVAGNLRTVTISSLSANQNYNWHIRAKCGTSWTDYSGTISFKTLGITKAEALAIPAAIVESPAPQSLKVFPNPSKGEFNLTLQVDGSINAVAKIQLVNMMGKTVYTETAEVNNGALLKTINTPSTFANGSYIVRVLVDDKLYKTQVIFNR